MTVFFSKGVFHLKTENLIYFKIHVEFIATLLPTLTCTVNVSTLPARKGWGAWGAVAPHFFAACFVECDIHLLHSCSSCNHPHHKAGACLDPSIYF